MIKGVFVGSVYSSKSSGDFKVLSVAGYGNIVIEFLLTGTEKIVSAHHMLNGYVKDPFYKSVMGVGFIGVGDHLSSKKGKRTKAYDYWSRMFNRCYNDKYHKDKPTYIDCSVCEEWHNFQNFASWYENNHPKDGAKYDLDKDIKVKGNKIYSPETCLFVTRKENSIESRAKNYKFTSPLGDIVDVYNLRGFCLSNNLSDSHMNGVFTGKRNSHKGWRKA